MPSIELTENEWGAVMNCMGYAPGRECIPLLNKISAQLTAQMQAARAPAPTEIKPTGNGQEVRHGE